MKWYHPAFLVSTWFGSGKLPKAPGTWGSLFTLPLFLLSHYVLLIANNESQFSYIYFSFITFLFVIGTWTTNIYMKHTRKHDPKEVVIDEVVGQMLVFYAGFMIIATGLGLFDIFYPQSGVRLTIERLHQILMTPLYIGLASVVYLVSFILFRIFDIWKPWPIKYCDKNIKGGFGVMFDDVFAGVYACIALYALAMVFSL